MSQMQNKKDEWGTTYFSPPHLFNRAVQFTTKVSGAFVLLPMSNTNRFPSGVTS